MFITTLLRITDQQRIARMRLRSNLLKNLIEIELDSDFTKRDRDWLNDDTGEITRGSYLDAYRESALKDNGTDVIAYLTW